ncbi:MAG: hypothetical protein COA94_05705 [Rickettsiales bacterium]|nr:MAG: hypothetical protein COA94_05705 [Rickettsiales bacterium]
MSKIYPANKKRIAKKKATGKKLLSSSVLAGLFISSACYTPLANSQDYAFYNQTRTFSGNIVASNNNPPAIELYNSTVIFKGTVEANSNRSFALYLRNNSTANFKKTMTANENSIGIFINDNSTVKFKKAAEFNKNSTGVFLNDSTGNFNHTLTANENSLGMILNNSTGKFKKAVEFNKNSTGMVLDNSTGKFKHTVTANENSLGMRLKNSTGNFDKNVTLTNNETGITTNTSTIIFKNKLIVSESTITGISILNSDVTFDTVELNNNKLGLSVTDSTVIFNGPLTVTNDSPVSSTGITASNGELVFNDDITSHDLILSDNSKIILSDGITASVPITTNSNNKNSVICKGSVTINHNIGEVGKLLEEVSFNSAGSRNSITLNAPIFASNALLDGTLGNFTNGIIISNNLKIKGASAANFIKGVSTGKDLSITDNATPDFQDDVTVSETLNITADAKPVFHKAVSSKDLSIADNAVPDFQDSVTTTGILNITVDAKPVFHKAVSSKDLSIADNAVPDFQDSVTATGILNITADAQPVFHKAVSSKDLSIADNAVPDFQDSVTATRILNITADAKPVFHKAVSSKDLSIADNAVPDFQDSVTATGILNITADAKPVFHKAISADADITITDNSEPEFKETVSSTGGNITVDLSSKPVFNNLASSVIVQGNSEPIFNNNTNGDVTILGTPTVAFNGASGGGVILPSSASATAPTLNFAADFSSNKELVIGSGAEVNLPEPTLNGTVRFAGLGIEADAKIKLGDNVILDTKISPLVDKEGRLEFLGNATISQDIGSGGKWLKEINFNSADSNIELMGNIFSETMSFNASNIKLLNDTKITTGQNSLNMHNNSLDLGSKSLLVSGKSVLTGKTTISTTFIADPGGNQGGHIIVDGAGSSFDFSGANPVEIILNADSPLPSASEYEYKLFTTQNGGTVIPANNITFTSAENNSLITWRYEPSTYILTSANEPEQLPVIVAKAGGDIEDVKVATFISNADLSDSEDATASILSNIGRLSEAEILEAVKRIQATANFGELADNIATQISNKLGERLTALTMENKFARAGVSSGDSGDDSGISMVNSADKYGVWMNGFYGKGRQGQREHSPKYHSRMHGITLGADTALRQDIIIGLAVSGVQTNSKFSNNKIDDKIKVNSLIFSLYAHKDLSNEWFIDGMISGGTNNITGKEQRILLGGKKAIATSKYKVRTHNGQFTVGYNKNISKNIILTPLAGLGYSWAGATKYTETGAGKQNLSVTTDSTYVLEAIFGGQIAFQKRIKNIAVTPELHAHVSYNFKTKRSLINAKLAGAKAPIPACLPRTNKLFYHIGGEINAQSESGKFEYGINYEAKLSKKYINHVGGLKLRVNF